MPPEEAQEAHGDREARTRGRHREPGLGRAGAGPARSEHHGVLQGLQRRDAEQPWRGGTCGDLGIRGPLVRLRAQDTACLGAAAQGGGSGQGSAEPHKTKVARVGRDQVRAIAERKLEDLNANDIDAAIKIISGTARSMGITVVD